jgi:hypothetical protein
MPIYFGKFLFHHFVTDIYCYPFCVIAAVFRENVLSNIATALIPEFVMGGALSHFFQSGSALLSTGNHKGVSESTRKHVNIQISAYIGE